MKSNLKIVFLFFATCLVCKNLNAHIPPNCVTVNNAEVCKGTSATLTATVDPSCCNYTWTYYWNTGATTSSISVSPNVTTTYSVTATCNGKDNYYASGVVTIDECKGCDTCISRFKPEIGKPYVFSAWVSCKNWMSDWNDNFTLNVPEIKLVFSGTSSSLTLMSRGDIIDGWQRIDTTFVIPTGTTHLEVQLKSTTSDTAFFDDLRIFPLGASMKSFVYDQTTMQFVAELDENNYATFYEYDEDGILVRVKRETVRGIETVKETRNNTIKK